MIRVCMIVHSHYDSDARIKNYAETLIECGAQVDVLCLRDKNRPINRTLGNLRILTIPLTRGKKKKNYLFEYLKAFIFFSVRLQTLFVEKRYQIIHIHNMPDFLVFTAFLQKMLGARLILDIHDPMPEFYMSKFQQEADNGLAVKLLRLQEKLSLCFANKVITANAYFKNNLVQRGTKREKVIIVNNVPNPSIFKRIKSKPYSLSKYASFTLIYPGTIAPRYGLDIAIRALPRLAKEIHNLRLLIIARQSKDGYMNELIALAESLGVSNNVKVLPVMRVEEMPRYMSQADVGIYTALPDPHMNIAVPLKVIEYAVVGIPIIASRLKVLEDLFTESAILFFDPGQVEQFADCVLELYSNAERCKQLVENADRIYIHLESWHRESDRYLNLIKRLSPDKMRSYTK